jgi:hypothetical protein
MTPVHAPSVETASLKAARNATKAPTTANQPLAVQPTARKSKLLAVEMEY